MGHYLQAVHDGGDAVITGWAECRPTPSLTQALGGYWFEVLVFCVAGQFVAAIGWAKGKRWYFSGFFFGYAFCTMGLAYKSYDFHTYVQKFAEYIRSPEATEVFRQAVARRWSLLITALIVVNGLILWFAYLRKE